MANKLQVQYKFGLAYEKLQLSNLVWICRMKLNGQMIQQRQGRNWFKNGVQLVFEQGYETVVSSIVFSMADQKDNEMASTLTVAYNNRGDMFKV
ncbi:hypothetical protein J1N35_042265 [Gossypium stocksii]|uniref:Uncharacterized protein n=1 Tax=Gossypium stocksii TaxID=47602 RepID=A0A9D3UH81_9ROSI|nr:hypothetical protein J1N35_042265 [Gossypium stocksii]